MSVAVSVRQVGHLKRSHATGDIVEQRKLLNRFSIISIQTIHSRIFAPKAIITPVQFLTRGNPKAIISKAVKIGKNILSRQSATKLELRHGILLKRKMHCFKCSRPYYFLINFLVFKRFTVEWSFGVPQFGQYNMRIKVLIND